jgi:hypothetical protein
MTRSRMSIPVAMALLGGVASCAGAPRPGAPPIDIASAYVAMFCLLNCPLSITLADEGIATDTMPLPAIHVLPATVRAINERN